MRIVKYTNRFKRDYRREESARHGKKLDNLLMEVVDMLAADKPLPRRNFDHLLTGDSDGRGNWLDVMNAGAGNHDFREIVLSLLFVGLFYRDIARSFALIHLSQAKLLGRLLPASFGARIVRGFRRCDLR